MPRTILSLVFLLLCFTVASALPQRAVLDFDGDNRTDYALVRNTSNNNPSVWYLLQSTDSFRGQTWGTPGDQLVPADYDGDLKWDIAVWRNGIFYILQSTNGALRAVQFGQTDDIPRNTQDFDGDGQADPTVTRNVGGTLTWYIQRSMLGFTSVAFGNSESDTGVRGDFDGDGKADVAVFRSTLGTPANTFYVLRSSDGNVQAQTFGDFNNDNIIPGDFDGDGKTDYAVARFGAVPRTWYWLHSSDGSFHALAFGGATDRPVPGDYDGDGKTDQAVWRAAAGTFYVNRSLLGFTAVPFGSSIDIAPGFFLQAR